MKRSKSLIDSYSGLNHVQIGKYFIRKDCVESVSEITPGQIEIRTVSGTVYGVEKLEARRVLKALSFNEK